MSKVVKGWESWKNWKIWKNWKNWNNWQEHNNQKNQKNHKNLKHVQQDSKDGYTLLEIVFVMMAITIFTSGLFVQSMDLFHRYALLQTVERIQQTLNQAKHHSLVYHERMTIEMKERSYTFMEESFEYIGDVLLQQPQNVVYNEHGRISQATTMVFRSHKYEQSIVIWLGQGAYEASSIRLRDD